MRSSSRLPHRAKRGNARRSLLVTIALTAALGLTGCGPGNSLNTGLNGTEESPTTLVASAAYVRTDDQANDRLASLQKAIDDLRESTKSGWVGRQDDVTGYLADLSGGRFLTEPGDDADAVITGLMDSYGQELFGVGMTDLLLGDEGASTVTGSSTIRATQQLEGVPVLDGALVFSIGEADTEPRVNAVRGRVFSGLSTSTTPAFPAGRASRAAQRLSGGAAQGEPLLVVLPGGEGTLAWQVTIVGAAPTGDGLALADGLYYMDALSGDLVEVRAASAHGRTMLPDVQQLATGSHGNRTLGRLRGAAAEDGAVEVTGDNPIGGTLTANGLLTDQGVALVDTTVPTYDPATGKGGIYTYDAHDSGNEDNLPGELYVERGQGTSIRDPEAIAAQALSRVVYDFYASLGRASWDGQGGSLISTVNFSDNSFCNSFFSDSLQPPQMVYGNPCGPGGTPAETTEVEIDTAAHEITHGVTATSAGLIYSGQSGAMNEGFSDYFGNVIGNRMKGIDTAEIFEGSCSGITEPTPMCRPNPDGGLSLRYMLNGNTMDDYLFALNPTYRLRTLGVDNQDQGGVHLNSSIWNNVLWTIRSRLAQIDGVSANDSPRAQNFDKIVYAALTTQLGPSAGFLDASRAIVQTAVDAGADSVILDTIRDTFAFDKICDDCSDLGTIPGVIISNSPSTQLAPAVHGDQVAWLDLAQGDGVFGFPASSKLGGTPSNLATTPETAQVVFAGDSTIALELPGSIVRYDADGSKTSVADGVGQSTLTAGLAGSDEGAAWQSAEDGTISYLDPEGTVVTENLPDLGGDTVVSMGTGAGTVGLGTDSGAVLLWQPGSGFSQLGQLDGAVLATAAYGNLVLAIDDAGHAALFDADGNRTDLSDQAIPFGAAMNADYAVWTNAVGTLEGGVARTEGVEFPDTDLYLYSNKTGGIYDLLPERGQQGFPAMSGDRVVWQDSVFGGDDILTAQVPSGL